MNIIQNLLLLSNAVSISCNSRDYKGYIPRIHMLPQIHVPRHIKYDLDISKYPQSSGPTRFVGIPFSPPI